MSTDLPSYKKPPVIETAISVQFLPIEGFTNAHLGIFWQAVRREFPRVRDAEPIASQVELFGEQVRRRPRVPTFRIGGGESPARLQMASEDDQTMLQLQNGRVVFNWRRINDAEYPRWHRVLPGFKKALESLQSLLRAEGLKDVEPNQWEVTYVNHLERGRDWNEPKDWPNLVPGLAGGVGSVAVGMLESIACNAQVLLPDNHGRLHIELHHGFKGLESDSAEILILQLTARGPATVSGVDLIGEQLEIGHGAIVRGFTDVTGEAAQAKWERER